MIQSLLHKGAIDFAYVLSMLHEHEEGKLVFFSLLQTHVERAASANIFTEMKIL